MCTCMLVRGSSVFCKDGMWLVKDVDAKIILALDSLASSCKLILKAELDC